MQDQLDLEMPERHPRRCVCSECELEWDRSGIQPVHLMPEELAKQFHGEAWRMGRGLSSIRTTDE